LIKFYIIFKKSSLNQQNLTNWIKANIAYIDLSDTDLASIEIATFMGLDKLVELKLDNNQLYEIKELTFEKLNSLKVLKLNNNHISFATSHVNQSQTNSKEVNGLINLSFIFKGLDNLQELYLHYNEIKEVDSNILNRNLNKLQVLYLNHNQLKFIKQNTFDNLVSLKKLRLDNNDIISIDNMDVFSKLSNLEMVNIQHNSFSNQNDQAKSLCSPIKNPKCKIISKLPRKIILTTKSSSTTPIIKTTLAPG
jgi:Leucine-rich repeat (LRR) protein